MKKVYPLALLVLLLTSCASVPKLLDQRKSDQAYAVAHKRASRTGRSRRPLKPRVLEDYLTAYQQIQGRDLEITRALERQAGTFKYVQLHQRYGDLYQRSLNLLTVAPHEAEFTRYPALAPATLEQQREHARKRAGAHYLTSIDVLRPAIATGDKTAARAAFYDHQLVSKYLPERDVEFIPERSHFRDVGTLRIELYVPRGDGDREMATALQNLKPLARGWTDLRTQPTDERVDLEAEVVYDSYQESGLTERCATTEHEEEVLDHIERKKVKEKVNDSTYVEKIIEIKHFKTVYATVTECEQEAMVCALGFVNVFSHGGDELRYQKDLRGVESWSNTYRSGSGDRRALPAFANSGFRQSPPRFETMLRRAMQELPGQARRAIIREYAPGRRNWLNL
ncbi:hypothetical protein [Neolewinella antarctica]|uniref:Lipoprotein n=1 Tax=Neolewinella antarctica TaxID=442734 RepID=A0ABX0XBH3_9BACT|nr:hypothetical protein [Neolewinella antarctica]NJC26621.1 hypothetical protein [Neolewinella antarctica]